MSFIELKDAEERYPHIPRDELERLLKNFNSIPQSKRTCKKFHKRLAHVNEKRNLEDLEQYGPRDIVDINPLINPCALNTVLLDFPVEILEIVCLYGESDERDMFFSIQDHVNRQTISDGCNNKTFIVSGAILVTLGRSNIYITHGVYARQFEMKHHEFRTNIKNFLRENRTKHIDCVVTTQIIHLWRCYNYFLCV